MGQTTAAGQWWASLDENVRACVLLHLPPRDVIHVALTCKRMAREAESDVIWAALYLRHFGTDFWGEDAGPHPYDRVPEPEPNEWLQQPAVGLFEAFHHQLGGGMRGRLLAFVQQQGQGGWKSAYKRMHVMVTEWRGLCVAAYLVAGHTSFARLSAIADILKANLFGVKSGISPRIDVISPTGECRLIKVDVPVTSIRRQGAVNFCVLRRPRNWWGQQDDMFRGLTLTKEHYIHYHLLLVYVIDCEMMDDPDYQEQVFREFHGLLGEGKGQYEQGLCVNLHLVNPTSVTNITSIRERLKLPLFISPDHHCPYYAGPVIIVVTAFTMADDETDEERDTREEHVVAAFNWLQRQPSARPYWHLPSHLPSAWTCALSDERYVRANPTRGFY